MVIDDRSENAGIPALLVRPGRWPDESPLSHVARTAAANDCPTIDWLIRLAGGDATDALTSVTTHQRLAPALGLLPEEHLATRSAAGAGEDAEEVRIGSAWLKGGYYDLSGAKVCPDCLQEAPYRRAIWDIGALPCCPEHGKRLVCACPACDAGLVIGRGPLTHCQCGYDLTRADAAPAGDGELALARWIAHLAGLWSEPEDAALSGAAAHLRTLSLRDLIDLVSLLGCELFETGAIGRLRPTSPRLWGDFARAGAAALVRWPEGLTEAMRFDRDRGRPAALSFRMRHRGIFDALADWFSGKRFEFLREAIETLEREEWADYQRRFSCRLPEEIASQEDLLVGVASVAGELGLEERIAMQLVADGVIPAVTRGTRTDVEDWLVEPDAARRLLSGMEASIRPIPAEGCATGLQLRWSRTISTRFGHPFSWLIWNTVSGNLPLVARSGAGKGLYDFFYDYDRLVDAALDGLAEGSEIVRAANLDVILGLKETPGRWLVDNTGLERTAHGGVPIEEMRNLCRSFTVPPRVFFGRDTGLPHGKAGLQILGVEPFASPQTGAPTAFYWRRDIEDALAAYIRRRKSRAEESAA